MVTAEDGLFLASPLRCRDRRTTRAVAAQPDGLSAALDAAPGQKWTEAALGEGSREPGGAGAARLKGQGSGSGGGGSRGLRAAGVPHPEQCS